MSKVMVHFLDFVADKYLRTMQLLCVLLSSNSGLCNLVVCASNFRFKPSISLFQLSHCFWHRRTRSSKHMKMFKMIMWIITRFSSLPNGNIWQQVCILHRTKYACTTHLDTSLAGNWMDFTTALAYSICGHCFWLFRWAWWACFLF
jgi:hypothetical protein